MTLPGRNFMDQVGPTWAARPSKVVVSHRRGTKITKLDISSIFDPKVGPSTLKSRSYVPKIIAGRPQEHRRHLKRAPGTPKIDKSCSQWPPERRLDPKVLPGGYIGVKIRLKPCFLIKHIGTTLAVGMPILWQICHRDSDCSLQHVCPPSC